MQKDKKVKMFKTYIRVEKYKQQLEDVKKNTKQNTTLIILITMIY